MSKYQHPMRRVVFHAYVREDGKEAIVRGKPYGLCPMLFRADTVAEAMSEAKKFRAEAVEKNEAAYIKRMEAAAAARAKRKEKAQ